MAGSSTENVVRFGLFELDFKAAQLSKNGTKIRLPQQPLQLLSMLLEHPGEILTREELRQRMWSPDVFVDFDHGLNKSIQKLRDALGDSARSPRYIETIPRVGYRFIAHVEGDISAANRPVETSPAAKSGRWRRRLYFRMALLGAVIVAVCGLALRWSSPVPPKVDGVLQITDDGNPKLLTNLVFDGARVYFNEEQKGSRVLAQVAATGGETGPLSPQIPGASLAALSSDSSHLLVLGDGWPYADLWMLPVPAGEPRKLAGLSVLSATLFPDGRIAFLRDNSLYVAEADGSKPHKLFNFATECANPVVSPDGKRIRLTVWRNLLVESIWEVNVDGSGAHPLLPGWQGGADVAFGRWTPDGKYFIFQSRRQGRADLWVLPEQRRWLGRASTPIRLTNGPLSYELPFPSPDGKHIYAIGLKRRGELVRYDLTTGQFVPYLSGISAMDATMSRDGKWMTYESYPDHSLWRSRTDGTERLQLTFPPTYIYFPRISPDGTRVAYGSMAADGTANAYVLSLAGGIPRKIADQAGIGVNWSPDGNSVIQALTASSGVGDKFLRLRIINLQTGKTEDIPESARKGGPWWPSSNMLLAASLAGEQWKFSTFDFKTGQWSDLVNGPLRNWITSVDGKYLYYTTENVDTQMIRVRLHDRKVETIGSLRDFRPVEDQVFGSWLGVTPEGSPLLTRDIGTEEIYDLSLRFH